jgi:hypothetical protein
MNIEAVNMKPTYIYKKFLNALRGGGEGLPRILKTEE